jgi:hypothetical protein
VEGPIYSWEPREGKPERQSEETACQVSRIQGQSLRQGMQAAESPEGPSPADFCPARMAWDISPPALQVRNLLCFKPPAMVTCFSSRRKASPGLH